MQRKIEDKGTFYRGTVSTEDGTELIITGRTKGTRTEEEMWSDLHQNREDSMKRNPNMEERIKKAKEADNQLARYKENRPNFIN